MWQTHGGPKVWLPWKPSLNRLDIVHLKRAEWSVNVVLPGDVLQEN